MGHDVVELSETGVDIHDVAMQQLDIGQPQRGDVALAARDGYAAQIDADELAVRILKRHRQQIAADTAAEFEHAAALDRRRAHPVQRREGRKAIGMGVFVDASGIEDVVIGGRRD